MGRSGYILILACVVFSCSKPRVSWLTRFAPPEQTFQIDPRDPNTITGARGTRIKIPAHAFDIDDDVNHLELRLTEAMDGFDMAATGLPMHFEDELGQDRTFESAGMFRVQAFEEGDPVELAKGKSLDVQFPNLTPGEKFRVYRYDGKKWQHDGHNQEKPPLFGESPRLPVAWLPAARVPVAVGIRQYAITDLTWWNFDYPRVDSVCIKGSVKNASGDFEIITIGHKPKGTHLAYSDEHFKTGALQRGDVTVLVISLSKGSFGVLRRKTGEIWGTYKQPESPHNFCEDVGEIELREIPEKALQDRKDFRKFVGLPEEEYQVNYPK